MNRRETHQMWKIKLKNGKKKFYVSLLISTINVF